jgi:hypothetical protein
MKKNNYYVGLLLVLLTGFNALAQEDSQSIESEEAKVGKNLANPIANMISIPFQNNTDIGIGAYNGSRNTLNIQPVIPVKLSSKLTLINRIVLPVITQVDITGPDTHQSGLSDALVSSFFSPALSKNGITWGIGPVFLLPTATNDFLGSDRFAAGPTGIILKQTSHWTFGVLANQIWSGSGDETDIEVNQLFVQPFLTHNWKTGAALGINAEIVENWDNNGTTVFLNPIVSGVTKMGGQILSVTVGPRIPLAAPKGREADYGVRAVFTLVYPKK